MDLAQVLRDQRQELEEGVGGKRIVEREAMDYFRNALGSKLIKVVTGVRRCGKSVLAYSLVRGKEFAYATFDDDRLAGVEAGRVLSAFYEVYGKDFKYVLLDEIQELDGWELFVNRLHRTGFNVIITGSNARLLSRELATHLTGRHVRIELFPFSFREFLSATGFRENLLTSRGQSVLKAELSKYLQSGGFPDVVVEKENPRIFLRELYRNIIERDVIGRHRIAYAKTFREIAFTLLSNPARSVSFNKLKNQFNLGSEHTAKNYVSYLEEAYLLFLMSRFSSKPVEVEKSEKKTYAVDTGMAGVLSAKSSEELGRSYENAVAVELLRRKALDPGLEVYYWKNPVHEEVDFVLKERSEVKQLLQVSYDVSDPGTKKREVKALVKAGKEIRCRDLLVITGDYEAEEKTRAGGTMRNIKFMPLYKWLLQMPVAP